MLVKFYSEAGTKEINIFFRLAGGIRMTQLKYMINTQLKIKLLRNEFIAYVKLLITDILLFVLIMNKII